MIGQDPLEELPPPPGVSAPQAAEPAPAGDGPATITASSDAKEP